MNIPAEWIKDVATIAKTVESLRTGILFDSEGSDEADTEPFAAQHFCLALAALEQAAHHFELAELHLTRNRKATR